MAMKMKDIWSEVKTKTLNDKRINEKALIKFYGIYTYT